MKVILQNILNNHTIYKLLKNENLTNFSKINIEINHLMIEQIQILMYKNQKRIMLEDIQQMNVEIKKNDKQPKNILNYQLIQLNQILMCLFSYTI